MEAYLDESGDLGFTDKSTKFFIMTLLTVRDEKRVHKCIKNVRTKKLKKQYKKVPELKFSKSDGFIKKSVLECLGRSDIEVRVIVLRKSSVYNYLHDHKNKIYNYLTKFLVESIIILPHEKNITLIVDRFLSKNSREDYDRYVKGKITEIIKRTVRIEIKHVDSQQDRCLQAVDFISGAVFHKYEFGNEEYYKIIEPKVKSIQMLF